MSCFFILNSVVASIAVPDANSTLHREQKNNPGTDVSGTGGTGNGVEDSGDILIQYYDLQFKFGKEIYMVFPDPPTAA